MRKSTAQPLTGDGTTLLPGLALCRSAGAKRFLLLSCRSDTLCWLPVNVACTTYDQQIAEGDNCLGEA